MTQPITTVETPEQVAERLLPCTCLFSAGIERNHSINCSASCRLGVAAALRAKDERIGELETRLAGWMAEKSGDCDEHAYGGHRPCPWCKIIELTAQVQAERERALEEILITVNACRRSRAWGEWNDALDEAMDEIRALAQKGDR